MSADSTHPQEEFISLHDAGGVRIERIISHGHASPPGFWYDQDADEWVMLIEGEASLEWFDGRTQKLMKGDHVFIARRVRHRVAEASKDAQWLAVHWSAPAFAAPFSPASVISAD